MHIANLRLGSEDKKVAEVLIGDINEHAPTLLVVSGTLTEKGTRKQYQAAFEYLDQINVVKIILPQAKARSSLNVFGKLSGPQKWLKTYVDGDVNPIYNDSEIAVLGLPTGKSTVLRNYDWSPQIN